MPKLSDLIQLAADGFRNVVAVAASADSEVLEAVSMAVELNLASFWLFDDEAKLTKLISLQFQHLTDHPEVRIVHAKTEKEAVTAAVKAVHAQEATVLMKGRVPTAGLLKAVLHPEYGLRTGNILSHIAAFEVQGFDRLLFLTDAGMNIAPDLQQKMQIIQNAVRIARSTGVECPIVAPLAAVEVVNPNMQPTLDAAALVAMNNRGQIRNCIIDGPLALDNAVSTQAAAHKGIDSPTAGRADILVVPDIEAGNILYKSLIYFANAKVGAIIAGAKAPIVLTSRSDSAESKLYSLALALQSSAIN